MITISVGQISCPYLGFDTVHDVDKLPDSATWTVKDVQRECIHVAEQLRELERKLG